MGILPGVSRVMAASHYWPYGHNQTEANVPAVSCIIGSAMARIPDGCDLEANIWQRLDKQVLFVVLPLKKCSTLAVLVRGFSQAFSPHRSLVLTSRKAKHGNSEGCGQI